MYECMYECMNVCLLYSCYLLVQCPTAVSATAIISSFLLTFLFTSFHFTALPFPSLQVRQADQLRAGLRGRAQRRAPRGVPALGVVLPDGRALGAQGRRLLRRDGQQTGSSSSTHCTGGGGSSRDGCTAFGSTCSCWCCWQWSYFSFLSCFAHLSYPSYLS
jgi:hypothetical protein